MEYINGIYNINNTIPKCFSIFFSILNFCLIPKNPDFANLKKWRILGENKTCFENQGFSLDFHLKKDNTLTMNN